MMKFTRLFLALLLTGIISPHLKADPWGKDADLASSCTKRTQRSRSIPKRVRTPLLGTFAEIAIRYHNEVISPCDGPRSHYSPSSSYYTLEAMRRYGFLQGWLLGCDRLMRENDEDWLYTKIVNVDGCLIKYDPVP